MKIYQLFAGLILSAFAACSLFAAVPKLMSYQGLLTSSGGQPLSGSFTVTFKIHDSPTGGTVIWSETQSNVNVTAGRFSALLGTIQPLDDSVFTEANRWLGLTVGTGGELVPRIQIAAVGYAMRIATVDGADGGRIGSSLTVNDTITATFIKSSTAKGAVGLNHYDDGSEATLPAFTLHNNNSDNDWAMQADDGGGLNLVSRKADNKSFRVKGAGTATANLEISGGTLCQYARAEAANGYVGFNWFQETVSPTYPSLTFANRNATNNWAIRQVDDGSLDMVTRGGSGKIRLRTQDADPQAVDLEVAGTTTTSVLAITGGKDVAEPFEISSGNTLEPGIVVVIDENHPGKLRISDSPYDRKVAGIVSGAGGINPGVTLRQEKQRVNGVNVALTGQVYAFATTSNGSIEPGDSLTTSDVPGHLMKATDDSKSHGAVIGKAMSRLEAGTGFVLVLVNLQ